MDENEEQNNNRRGPAVEEVNDGNDNNDDNVNEADEDENENANDGNNNNNNVMIDIDLEEDEEDGDNDSTYDGGVASNTEANPDESSSKVKKHSSECDLVSSETATRRDQYISYARISKENRN